MGVPKKDRPNPLEAEIKKACQDYLDIQESLGKLYYLRNNSFSGQILRGNGTKGFIRNNKKGSADIIVFLKGGKTIWCEFKRPKNSKQSPEQVDFENRITKLGFKYYVVRSLDDLISALK